VYLAIIALVPLAFFFLFKNRLFGFSLAVFLGLVILISRMLYLEKEALDSDYYFIFLLTLVLWSGILIIFYSIIFGLLNLVKNLILRPDSENTDLKRP